eukprot:tig00020961_g16634.t1
MVAFSAVVGLPRSASSLAGPSASVQCFQPSRPPRLRLPSDRLAFFGGILQPSPSPSTTALRRRRRAGIDAGGVRPVVSSLLDFSLRDLGPNKRDIGLLFVSRAMRTFSIGLVNVILVLYLKEVGLSAPEIGTLFTLVLAGDAGLSLWIATIADRVGRRKVIRAMAASVVGAGLVFSMGVDSLPLLTVASLVGIIRPGGGDLGPFLAIEQAALSQLVSNECRTTVMGWYQLTGSLSQALGALCSGALSSGALGAGSTELESYRQVLVLYSLLGVVVIFLSTLMSPAVEFYGPDGAPTPALSLAPHSPRPSGVPPATPWLIRSLPAGLGSWFERHLPVSSPVIARLCLLLALDSFSSNFVMQTVVSDWFNVRWGAEPAALGRIFFCTNVVAGFSSLLSATIAKRVGLIRTMVLTHLPSNLFLMTIPLAPTFPAAVGAYLLRGGLGYMDVPARNSYIVAVVPPSERTAAAGVCNIARTAGASLSPLVAGLLAEQGAGALGPGALRDAPFFLAGTLALAYDALLLLQFRNIRPPEEAPGPLAPSPSDASPPGPEQPAPPAGSAKDPE